MELAHKLGIEHAHFTVEDESPRGQLSDRGGQISEGRGVVNTLTGDEADSGALFQRDHPPPVVLGLENPAGRHRRRPLHRRPRRRRRREALGRAHRVA